MKTTVIQKAIPNFLTSFRCVSAIIVPLLIVYGDEIYYYKYKYDSTVLGRKGPKKP